MSKLAKWKLVSEIAEVWSQQDQEVREYIARGLMEEYERQYAACGLPAVDWAFMGMSDNYKQKNFDAWFHRVSTTFLNSKPDAWLRAQHKQDVLAVS